MLSRLFDQFDPFDFFDDTFLAFRDLGRSLSNYKKNDDGSYLLTVDVPGINESDLNIELAEDNVLNISGERKTETSSYSVKKSLYIGDQIDPTSIKAELKNGVLTITLSPKSLPPAKEVKKIPISTSR